MFQVNPGFRADDLAVVRIQVPNDLASDDEASAFVAALAREITRVPGVQSVSGSSALPFSGRVHSSSFELEGQPAGAFGKHPEALRQSVLPGFHEVMGIPVLAGRDFRDTDVRSAPEVVMVSRSMARRYWPGESPLGRRIVRDDRTWEIVGVVGDVLHADLRTPEKPTFYFPYHQQPMGALSLVVRSQQDPAALLGPLQRAAWSLEPTLPIEEVGTVRSLLAGSAAGDRYRTFLLAAFGAAAALLTGVGIFAVTARAVARRTREFGIRMALGAAGPSIVRLVVRQEATALLLGVALGLAGALATGRLLSGFLFGVRADDPLTYLGATAFLLGLGLLASLLPARRTLRQEPSRVLRAE
jgi:putative ABC transport system permease protein